MVTYLTTDVDLRLKYKQDIRFHYEIKSSVVTPPTRKCGSVFNLSLSFFYEDHNLECPMTKYE